MTDKSIFSQLFVNFPKKTTIQQLHIWHRVVEIYSSLRLTKTTDRLPAIAGLAKAFEKLRTGEVYRSGLWQKTIVKALAWSRKEEGEDSLLQNSEPSWSWALVPGGISYLYTDGEPTAICKIVHPSIVDGMISRRC